MCAIKHPDFSQWIVVLLLLSVLLLGACLPEEQQGPVAQATLTPTPRSTPLPPVATAVPPGMEENPVSMVIRPPRGAVAVVSEVQIADFEQALLEQTGLVIDVQVVERFAEALAALCGSTPTRVSVAWLDGLTYAAAVAQGCGSSVLQIERDSSPGDPIQIVAGSRSNLSSIQNLRGASFCRVSHEDYESWLVPSLLLRANGVDPLNGLDEVIDFQDMDALIEAVIDGECRAAGISESAYLDLSSSVREDLEVVESTPPFPHGVLMYPVNLTLGERLRLTDGLLALAADRAGASVLRPLLDQDDLVPGDDDDFEDLARFLEQTGLDFAQLGG